MERRYLRQIGTNKAPFVYTEALAKRKDMVPFDSDAAKNMIAAKRKLLDELRANQVVDQEAILVGKARAGQLRDDSIAIHQLDKEIESAKRAGVMTPEAQGGESQPITKRQKQIDSDRQIQEIQTMTRKTHVETYLANNYGVMLSEDDLAMSLKEIKDIAIQKRINTLFEKPEEEL